MAGSAGSQITKNRLSVLINTERRRRGQSLQQAAADLDSSIQTVANWERGASPLKEKLPKLSSYLGLSITTTTRIWLQNRKPMGRPRFS